MVLAFIKLNRSLHNGYATTEKLPTVRIGCGADGPFYYFTNLNPDLPNFGLSEDGYYHLCLSLLDIVGDYQYPGFIREALNLCKVDPEIKESWQASDTCLQWLVWEGCVVKHDLREMRKFLPNKADRKAIMSYSDKNVSLLNGGLELTMGVEDEAYQGEFFDYDVNHEFTWTLNGCGFFESAYDYEIANGI